LNPLQKQKVKLDPQNYSQMISLMDTLHLAGKLIIVATHDVDFAAARGELLFVIGKAGTAR
jgi:energy-coupling factor transporter ATP-binding protein EcfA2